MTVPCPEFTPSQVNNALCECQLTWLEHTPHAKQLFIAHTDGVRVTEVMRAIAEHEKIHCTDYRPSEDWTPGAVMPNCLCGAERRLHKPLDVIRGVRRHRAKACKGFKSDITSPGTCIACKARWLDHQVECRGLVIEQRAHLHQVWCKSVILPGEHICNCLTDEEKQAALEEKHMDCRAFKVKAKDTAICACGGKFAQHSHQARDGFDHFVTWLAAHMSNHDVLAWYVTLATTPIKRLSELERLIKDPMYKVVAGARAPDSTTCGALYEALTGVHVITSPNEKRDFRLPAPNLLTPVCYSCQTEVVPVQGTLCLDCKDYYLRMKTAPTLEADFTGGPNDRPEES